MAISNSIFAGKIRKSTGNVTAKVLQGRVILSQKVETNTSKSFAQTTQRMRFRYAVLSAELMKPIIKNSFVQRGQYESSYNAFMKHCLQTGRVISPATGGFTRLTYAPIDFQISRGNHVTWEQPVAPDTMHTGWGGSFGNSEERGAALTRNRLITDGLKVGEMLSVIVVVALNPESTIMCWKRILRTGEEDWIDEESPLYTQYVVDPLNDTSIEPRNSVGLIDPTDKTIVAGAVIRSANVGTPAFDCSTTFLTCLTDAQLRIAYYGATPPSGEFLRINDLNADTWTINDLRNGGWEVDEPNILAPASLGYLEQVSETMGDGVVTTE